MNSAWSVLDGNIIFTKQIQPPTLLTYGLGRFHEIRQGGIISSDNDRPSKEMLPVLFETKNHTEEFATGDTVPGLSRCQGSTGVTYHMQLPLLFLLQDSTQGSVRGVSVKHILAVVAGGDKDWCRGEGTFKLLEGCLTVWGPLEGCPFLVKLCKGRAMFAKLQTKVR